MKKIKKKRNFSLWRILFIALLAMVLHLGVFLPMLVDFKSDLIGDAPFSFMGSSESKGKDIDFSGIAEKWGLSPSAVPLLKMQAERQVDYNSTTNILSFYHAQKTGGTSLSDVLRKLFRHGVVPGSDRSRYFKDDYFKKSVLQNKPIDFWSRQRVLYSHSPLRPMDGEVQELQNGKGNLLPYLRSKIAPLAEKKYRLLTLIREPVYWRASAHFEALCHIGSWIAEKQKSLGWNSSVCPKVNLTDVGRVRLERAIKANCTAVKTTTCKHIREGKNPFDYCGSIDIFLESGRMHNIMHRKFFGLLPQPPSVTNSTTPTYEDVELYTLKDLGGLVDFDETYREDYIWFGITERMQESMCLFYYTLKLDPAPTGMPHERYKKCRPTAYWEERHFQWVHEHEKFDYAIWRAGNAILDVRIEAMKLEIQAFLDAGESLESIRYLGPGCFSELKKTRRKE